MPEEFFNERTSPGEGDAPGLAGIEWPQIPTSTDATAPQQGTAPKDAAMSNDSARLRAVAGQVSRIHGQCMDPSHVSGLSDTWDSTMPKYATTLQGAAMPEDDIPLGPGSSLEAERATNTALAIVRRWLVELREGRTSTLSHRPWTQSSMYQDTANPHVATMPDDTISKDGAVPVPRRPIISEAIKSVAAPILRRKRLENDRPTRHLYSNKNAAGDSQKALSERSTRHGKDVAPSQNKTYKPPMPLPPHLYRMLRLGPVGHHEIASKWNKGLSGDLVPKIIEALAGVSWTTLDIFRVAPRHSHDTKGPICLLVGVKPASTSSADAERISVDCERVLSQHDVRDVQCIVQEATISQLVTKPTGEYQMPLHGQPNEASRQDPGATPLAILGRETNGNQVQDSDGLGSGISLSGSASYGTKGMYLDVTDSEGKTSKVALTCRHVPLPEESEFDFQLAFRHGLSSLPIIELPISQMSVEQMKCERSLTYLNKTKRHLQEPVLPGPLDRRSRAHLNRVLYRISKHESLARQLRLSPRTMGHVAYAPPFDVALLTPSTTTDWLVDWAIVALDPSMHIMDLARLSNRVSVNLTQDAREGIRKSFEKDGLGSDVPEGVMSLEGIIPEDEIRARKDDKNLLVAKHGATTGLTYGISNNLMSLAHGEFGEREAMVEEWPVIGLLDLARGAARSRMDFSAPGDSGSCVFDARNGRIGGQLHAGREWDFHPQDPGHVVGAVDVTYVTPIERLLKDIEWRGLAVSLP